MYSSIRRYQLVKGHPDLLREKADAVLMPKLSALDGFVSYQVIVTGLGGDGLPGVVTVSVFEDEAQAKASSRLAADWAREMSGVFALQKLGEESGRIISRTGPN
ncbi:hypothetical protein [uncultured Thiohalocapsa sp.]|uniref:hypothetical protein n=1 Tax=uncultured Thiohalocapsa sp. TaxID=768990 RepID=UPI0025F115B0|nr:hypothetical protein [uncultured Thiohalocapsa sp.]